MDKKEDDHHIFLKGNLLPFLNNNENEYDTSDSENKIFIILKSFLYLTVTISIVIAIVWRVSIYAKWFSNNKTENEPVPVSITKWLWNMFTTFFGKLKEGAFYLWSRKALLIGVLVFATLITLYYYFLTNGPYQLILNYSKYVSYGFIMLITFAILYLGVLKKNKEYKDQTEGKNDDGKVLNFVKKFSFESSKYLFYLICIGLGLAIFSVLGLTVMNNDAVPLTTAYFVMGMCVLGILFLGYTQLKKLDVVEKNIGGDSMMSKILSFLYHFVFIIPCLFLETAKYLFNEFKKTPEVVYKVLFAEIILVTLFIIVPIIQKIFYTNTFVKTDRISNINARLESITKEINESNNKIYYIKQFDYIKEETKDETIIKGVKSKQISNDVWEYILTNSYNMQTNEPLLENELLNNGYLNKSDEDKKILDASVKYIQKYVPKIILLKNNIEDLKNEEEKLNKILKEKSNESKGTILINKPRHLSVLRKRNDDGKMMRYQNLSDVYFDGMYNYNYCISFWVFLHANSNSNKYKSILNYSNKPNILYNFNDGKGILRIKMNDKKIMDYKKMKLQKWNNIVINYINGTLDVFLNGKLIGTYDGVIPYMSSDIVSIGDDNGLSGGICNLVYFPTHISKNRIDTNYFMFKGKNPPIN